MKQIILLSISISILLTSCGSTINVPEEKYVINDSKLTKDELYVKANLWMIDIFNNAKSVIQFSDKEAGVIKGRYSLHYIAPSTYVAEQSYSATITLTMNDGFIEMKINSEPINSLYYTQSTYRKDIDRIKVSFYNEFGSN